MNRTIRALTVLLAGLGTACPLDTAAAEPATTPRNVIFLLGDGMGFAQVKAYRMYADDPATELVEPLPMEAYLVGAVSTDSIRLECNSDGTDCVRDPHGFTDSASSATAYATGHDTVVGRISKTTEGEPLATILEGAKAAGKSTGMVATSQITHASPAAFGSHVDSRANQASIADQYLDTKWQDAPMVDVLLGGGAVYMRRGDRDLVPEFRAAGYDIALNRAQLLAADSDRLLGLFSQEGMPRAWNRGPDVPSLAEMTGAALKVLARNPEGFFLMVEGSQIDWGAHRNSVVDVISEMEDFNAAVRLALDFATQQGDTLVIVTADHETGGMALGVEGKSRWDPRPMRGVKRTPEWMADRFMQGEETLSAFIAPQLPFELTAAEVSALDRAERERDRIRDAIAELFNKRTFTGWSTGGHTGVDVPLYVYGPGRERFGGVMQNEDVGRVLRALFLPGTD